MSYCNWDKASNITKKYHDTEWGVPVYDDRKQFEFLMMESMQCGLSWDIIMKKRDVLRLCFDNFDFDSIAKFDDNDVQRILNTEGMIKSKPKIQAVINNAKCFQQIRKEYGSFCNYLWKYTDNKTILYEKHEEGYIPASNGLSDKISKDLKKRGFKYIGTVTIYSHLQAAGLINDHDKNCERYNFINSNYPTVRKRRILEKNVNKF